MTEFRIDPMPSRKLNSDRVVYYVYSVSKVEKKLVAKFDSTIEKAELIKDFENFTSEQKLELKNFVTNMRFVIDRLNLPAKLNRSYRISLPEPLQKTLVTLSELTEKHNIEFNPITAMLNGLLNHIVTTEKRINQYEDCYILQDIGVNVEDNSKELQEKEIRKYTKKIFKDLLALPGSLDKYASIANNFYKKETNLNSTTIVRYSEGKAKPSQWSISCALTVLGIEQMSLINKKIPSSILIHLWLTPLRYIGEIKNYNEACQFYHTIFKTDELPDEIKILFKSELLKSI